jgi:hypothetical protein
MPSTPNTGTQVYQGEKYTLVGSADTLIKATGGRLHCILVSAGDAANTLNVWNNNTLGDFDTADLVLAKAAVARGQIFECDIPCSQGIHIFPGSTITVTVIWS